MFDTLKNRFGPMASIEPQRGRRGAERQKTSESIYFSEDMKSVVILGVVVPRAKVLAPMTEKLDFDYTPDSLRLLKEIAVSYVNKMPLVVAGESGVGKTYAIRKFGELIGATVHVKSVDEDTTMKSLKVKANLKPGGGVTYTDGPIIEAARAKEGEVHIVLLDEINTMRSEAASGLHGILDAWKTGGKIPTEVPKDDPNDNTYEKVAIPRDRVFFAMTMNPNGAGYRGRKDLDAALADRAFVTHQVADPETTRHARILRQGGTIAMPAHEFLYTRAEGAMTLSELERLSNYDRLHNAYLTFHKVLAANVREGKIGRNQSGEIYLGSLRMDERVRTFLCSFNDSRNGTLAEVFQKAMAFLYIPMFQDDSDRRRVFEMINVFSPEDTKVTTGAGLPKARATRELAPSDQFSRGGKEVFSLQEVLADVARAERILGTDKVMGPAQIESVLGISLHEAPKIPFSDAELKNAAGMGMMLVLRVSEIQGSSSAASKGSIQRMSPRLIRELGRGVLSGRGLKQFYGDDAEWVNSGTSNDSPRAGWALVDTSAVGAGLQFKGNGLGQLDAAVSRARSVFGMLGKLPKKFADAYKAYAGGGERADIKSYLGLDSYSSYYKDRAVELLAGRASVVKFVRQSPLEVLYDQVLYYGSTGRILGNGLGIVATGLATNAKKDNALRVVRFSQRDGFVLDDYNPKKLASLSRVTTLCSFIG